MALAFALTDLTVLGYVISRKGRMTMLRTMAGNWSKSRSWRNLEHVLEVASGIGRSY